MTWWGGAWHLRLYIDGILSQLQLRSRAWSGHMLDKPHLILTTNLILLPAMFLKKRFPLPLVNLISLLSD